MNQIYNEYKLEREIAFKEKKCETEVINRIFIIFMFKLIIFLKLKNLRSIICFVDDMIAKSGESTNQLHVMISDTNVFDMSAYAYSSLCLEFDQFNFFSKKSSNLKNNQNLLSEILLNDINKICIGKYRLREIESLLFCNSNNFNNLNKNIVIWFAVTGKKNDTDFEMFHGNKNISNINMVFVNKQ
jgi:hypothetical protein